jgi:hypothetical protein
MGGFTRSRPLLAAGVVLAWVAACSASAPTADEILAGARTAAAAGNKNVFLLFDASW